MTPLCEDRIARYMSDTPGIAIKYQKPSAETKWIYHWVLFEEGSDVIVYGTGYQGSDDMSHAWEDKFENAHLYHD